MRNGAPKTAAEQPDAVAHAVGDFLADRLRPFNHAANCLTRRRRTRPSQWSPPALRAFSSACFFSVSRSPFSNPVPTFFKIVGPLLENPLAFRLHFAADLDGFLAVGHRRHRRNRGGLLAQPARILVGIFLADERPRIGRGFGELGAGETREIGQAQPEHPQDRQHDRKRDSRRVDLARRGFQTHARIRRRAVNSRRTDPRRRLRSAARAAAGGSGASA